MEALAPTRARKAQCQRTTTTWTPEEDELLTRLVNEANGSPSWSSISRYFDHKTAPQLAGRWDKVLNPSLIKGSWTAEEDRTILRFVEENGVRDWSKLALLLNGRTGKQCRERFKNHLDPSVSHDPWTPEEDRKLIELHSQYGNAWTKMATFFEGRSDNCIKNRWNSTLKKRIERQLRGEPLVLKRGRKPKSSTVPSDIPCPVVHDDLYEPLRSPEICSSPVVTKLPVVEFVPLGASLNFGCFHGSCSPICSVVENRLNLQRMLNEIA